MKKSLILAAALLACMITTVSAQHVFNKDDGITDFNNQPQPAPAGNTFVKWGRTKGTNWPFPFNTDNFKCYYFNGTPFRLRFPNNYNPNGTKYPVILFFHGIGETGPIYDNENNIAWGAKQFEARIDNGEFNAFLLFPQTSTGDWSPSFNNINAILDELNNFYNADQDRLITMGLSLGGDGTMKYTFQYPQRSAISIPASPGSIGDFTQSPTPFIHIPFWIASGGLDDSFANPQRVQAFVDNFNSQGGNIKWTYYPDRGHGTWPYMWDEPVMVPYWKAAHKANPLAFNYQTQLSQSVSSIKLGITPGYPQYQWQRNNIDLPNTTNEITVNQPGTYRTRFRRTAGGNWSEWSPNPVVITSATPTDAQPPTTPGNLHVVATTTSSISLDWDNSTDNVGVAGYDVFVNGAKRASPTTSDATIDNLSASTTYSFTVQAHDAANNYSGNSPAINGTTATPPDVLQPTVPANLHVVTASTNSVTLDWDNSSDNIGVTGYDIYVNGVFKLSTTNSDGVASGLNPATTYSFTVRAKDLANNLSAFSSAVNGTTASVPDVTAPSVPANLHVVTASTSSITLDWDNSTDNVGVAGYDMFVNGSQQYSSTSSDVVASGLNPATTYSFSVRAKDASGNLSAQTGAVNGTTSSVPDATPPSTPGNLHVVSVTTNSITLDWDNSSDNVGVSGYDVFVNGTKQYSNTSSDIVATGLNPGTTYAFRVQAKDASNNFSGFSNTVNGTTSNAPDGTPPSAPGNLHVVSVTTNSVSLDWDNSSDNVGVSGYDIFVNGSKQYSSTNSDIVATGMSPATNYSFSVQAKDAANNFSAFSNTVNGTTSAVSSGGGLSYKYYEGSFTSLPNFSSLSPLKTGTTGLPDISVRNAGVNDNFAFLWEGYIVLPSAGTYTFETVSDDGSKLYFNTAYSAAANALVNNDGLHAATAVSAQVTMAAGTYPIAISFFEATGGEAMQVYWSGPGIPRQLIPAAAFTNMGMPPTGSQGLSYKYYEGSFTSLPNFNALSPVKTGTSGSADIGVRNAGVNDNYAFLWEGFITLPTAGAYTFETVSDDGSKLYFNTTYSAGANALVNNDGLHALTSVTGTTASMAAGAYPVAITFFEATGGEGMQVYWTGPGIARQLIPASAFTTSGTPPSATNGINYKYYEGALNTLPNFNALSPVKTGTTAVADITVRTAGVNDNFAFLWEGFITLPNAGVYTFETVSDDGSKLYFNTAYSAGANALVNNDGLHAANSATGNTGSMSAGTYPIAITYFERDGGESMQVYWSGPGIARQLIPAAAFTTNGSTPPVSTGGLNYRYYEGSFTTLPNFNALGAVKTGTSPNADISVRNAGVNDNFAFLWEGYIHLPTAGTYTFETVSDDGSKLYFNSSYSAGATALVNNDGLHAASSATGSVNMAAGSYPIAITYFEKDGGENMQVYWTGPGIARQLIPNSAFTQTSAAAGELVMSHKAESLAQVAEMVEKIDVKQFYPNPFTDHFNINFYNQSVAGRVTVDITNISGRVVYRKDFGIAGAGGTSLRIDAGKQVQIPGVYFVRMMVNGVPVKMVKMLKK